MKSLEIIKRRINEIYGFDDKWEEVEELEQIKQDLEALEIIKKKKVDVRLLAIYIFIPSSDEEKLKNYNKHCKHVNHELTMEELLKLKQWLEKEEN